ncbi:hypothetical protein SAMN04487948_11289 [Halogranum amylolyticum]|uniref:Winged helix-turn-helix domain n=1 Tax=Halogranum amylolyticum TaxID=660520 RepID=A0A1H8USK2_9EURY|nr:hypothetical protein [Halogranum amylolyticum]SEP06185.1 hypothetical protein SAMN04487948_11289 [Halogranum amylolyticum]
MQSDGYMGTMRNSRTPLSASAEEALDLLRPEIEATSAGLSQSAAESLLESEEFTGDDAAAVLTELLQKGYLYEVDGLLRLP